MSMEFKEYSSFTFDSKTIYQTIDNVEEKVCRWTLGSDNNLIYEVFPHEEPNEKARKMGHYVIPCRRVSKISSELYTKWSNYLRDCAIHGEYKPNGDRRSIHEY